MRSVIRLPAALQRRLDGTISTLLTSQQSRTVDFGRPLREEALVDPGALFHDNGSILTSAGISAGIDCSLHLVGRLLGDGVAASTANYMEYGPGR